MKQVLLSIAILILNLSVNAQIVSKFTWDDASLSPLKAVVGPDAVSVGSSTVINMLTASNGALNPGTPTKDIDLVLANSAYYNIPSIDLSVDFRREESEAYFLTRGSSFDFGVNGGKLFVKFTVNNGDGTNTVINSGSVYNVPNDKTFHNYRFMYDNATGVANVWVDGTSVYNYNGVGGRDLFWSSNNLVIGRLMDATGKNIAVFDNFELRLAPAALVLPVKFTSFTATAKSNGVQVKWATANESNLKNYIVEKSFDGLSFETVKTVAAKGSSISNEYEITDVLNTANVSYRVKAVDQDGKITYSVIRTVSAASANVSAEITAYPNPAVSTVNLKFNSSEAAVYNYTIYLQDGRKVQNGQQSVEKGIATIAVQFNQSIPHNTVVLIVVENSKSTVRETIRIVRK